jgi:DNA-binding NtrC family response regulator
MAKTSKKKKAAPGKVSLGKARLLVVDDEADFAKMVQKALAQWGYTVDVATKATQGMILQRKHSYDLALLDMLMPEMTGLELMQYLKGRDKKIFVLIMTAYGSFSLGIESLKRGACDYLPKPFKLKTLREKVAEALKRRSKYLQEQRFFPQRASMDEW